ncbi:sex-determining region Y protein-like isoform X2 [Phyllopteryx taeniolatus]|uniref:sex-determining region Y protein-like isoform X2 n=1 Tax=Phyllopteryx taeniolatus TaxID=161469 RepID=UPI002AD305CA|nr:sex-determining region Y protein-like isoform X2 [Phyllopteryx taeniolatus]
MRIQKWMDKNVEGSTTPSTAERREQERGGCFIQIRRNVPKESGNCGGFKRGAGETGRHHLEVPLRWARVGPTGPVYCQQRIPAKNLSGKLPNLATHSRLISILSLWRPSAVTEQVHGGPGAEATLGWPPTGILSASLFGNVSTRFKLGLHHHQRRLGLHHHHHRRLSLHHHHRRLGLHHHHRRLGLHHHHRRLGLHHHHHRRLGLHHHHHRRLGLHHHHHRRLMRKLAA